MSPAKMFYTDDMPTLIEIARSHPFGDLITMGTTAPLTTGVPMLIDDTGDTIIVEGHLTRTNPQWQQSQMDREALAVFRAEHAYISPRWYVSTSTTQQHVPTWNYSRVEAQGILEFYDDPTVLRKLVTDLTAYFEPPAGWSPNASPEGYIDNQLRAIVGFRLHVRELRGIRKLSQNKPVEDRKAVISSLTELGQNVLAQTMQDLLSHNGQ